VDVSPLGLVVMGCGLGGLGLGLVLVLEMIKEVRHWEEGIEKKMN
jgi:hypothetical protein